MLQDEGTSSSDGSHGAGNQRQSGFDRLRKGPVTVGGLSLLRTLDRLRRIHSHGVMLPASGAILASRLLALARFASRARATAVSRLPEARRLAVVVAFLRTLEAPAYNDVLDMLEALLQEIFTSGKSRLQGASARPPGSTLRSRVPSMSAAAD